MPLNLSKVEKLLYDNKFIVVAFYLFEDLCRYMKLFSVETGETLMLFIASEFEFVLSEKDVGDRPAYIIKPINFESGSDVPERFAEYPDEKRLEEKYEQNLNISGSTPTSGDTMEQQIESNYNKKIYLNDFSKDQVAILKDCYRQLKRLALSVQELRYNICIIQESYMCSVEHTDDIACYLVSSQTTQNKRVFQVVADLEYFYEKSSTINFDLESIRTGMYKVLDKNQDTNTVNLEKLTTLLMHVRPSINAVVKKKAEFVRYIEKYKSLLKNETDYEQKMLKDLNALNEKRDTNYFNDTAYVHQKSALESKLISCKALRNMILKNMEEVQTLCDNVYLIVDKTEFDSSIMIDRVIKNFSELENIK